MLWKRMFFDFTSKTKKRIEKLRLIVQLNKEIFWVVFFEINLADEPKKPPSRYIIILRRSEKKDNVIKIALRINAIANILKLYFIFGFKN